jgi:hypothetical protein
MKLDILKHFQSTLGNSELVLSHGGTDVYKWPDPTDDGDFILSTVGMAKNIRSHIESKHSPHSRPAIEVMMFCEAHDVALAAGLLIEIAAYPKRENSFIHWWHVLPLGRPITPDSELRNLLFIPPPFDGQFATFESKGNRIDVTWVIPISDGERAVFESQGTEALEQRLEENNVVVADLYRKSIA